MSLAASRSPHLDCPRCPIPLVRLPHRGARVDHCDCCQGSFWDAGDLRLLLGEAALPSRWQDLPLAVSKDRGLLCCPADGAPMRHLTLEDRDLELDVCPSCEGIWFDEGEAPQLEALMRNALQRAFIQGRRAPEAPSVAPAMAGVFDPDGLLSVAVPLVAIAFAATALWIALVPGF